jgi:flagellar hook-associated protein 2
MSSDITTSLTLASQIDSLVQTYRTSLRSPITTLENTKTTLTARLSVLTELKTRLATLNTIAKKLSLSGAESAFRQFTVSSTQPGIGSATASSAAAPGSHTLKVTQLAKADTVLGAQVTSAGTEIVTGTGTGVRSFRLTVNGVNTAVDVTLESGDTNSTVLGKIAAAVNGGTSGVTASVVMDTPTTSRLVFQSGATGSTQAVSMADTTGTLLAHIGLTASVISGRTAVAGTSAGFVYSSTALLNAKFSLDGIQMERTSNSIQDALSGVTLELKGTQAAADDPVVLAVGYDNEKIRSTVGEFLDAYNKAITYIADKTAVDPNNNVRQILAGDSAIRRLRIQMRGIGGGSVDSVTAGDPATLSAIGISVADDGTLTLSNTARFDAVLAGGIERVTNLFNSTSGIAVRMTALVDGFATSGGMIDASKEGIDGQITAIKSRVKRMEEVVDRKVERYRAEFVRLQNTLELVTQQQAIMTAILDGLT